MPSLNSGQVANGGADETSKMEDFRWALLDWHGRVASVTTHWTWQVEALLITMPDSCSKLCFNVPVLAEGAYISALGEDYSIEVFLVFIIIFITISSI